ncbi:hypothetical protein G3I01_00400 [Gramella sp. MT6]|uniref:hypothetical protein n=1 Tax=Gramella sp. MT6 TaxID=2705471 RepID=UPI001C5DC2C0|nr:hypothetical protein [Gramella sp. MT6]QYA24028.1 hypothetical protein G3I01_00400 [Gramella sp. MT6]
MIRKKIKQSFRNFLVTRVVRRTNLILIVSSGRTGTKFFEFFFKNVFEKYPVYHEPKPDLFDLSFQKILAEVSDEGIKRAIFSYRSKLIGNFYSNKDLVKYAFFKKPLYVESNPFIYPVLEEFSSNFRSTKYLFITRDFKTFCVSAYNKDPQGDGKNDFYGISDRRKRITAKDLGEKLPWEWKNLNRIEKIAWYWNMSNRHLYYGLKNKDYIHLNFEDIFNKDKNVQNEAITRLSSFFGIKILEPNSLSTIMRTKINKSKQISKINSINDLDSKTQDRIDFLTKEMREILGYRPIK